MKTWALPREGAVFPRLKSQDMPTGLYQLAGAAITEGQGLGSLNHRNSYHLEPESKIMVLAGLLLPESCVGEICSRFTP